MVFRRVSGVRNFDVRNSSCELLGSLESDGCPF